MSESIDLDLIIKVSKDAGKVIMDFYHSKIDVDLKEDLSPLTLADRKAHQLIKEKLEASYPRIPILSEEGELPLYEERKKWDTFFIIDPLDGTKEFLKKNGEFTVNIGLIEKGRPVLGVVHAPALGTTYWAKKGHGSYKQGLEGRAEKICVRLRPKKDEEPWVVVGSRSHQSPEFKEFLNHLPLHRVVSMGSSLKICLVAEGKADLYPRLGPTCEWDTAAAQVIVEEANGQLLEYPSLCPLEYNKPNKKLLNPHFLVCESPL